MSPAGSRQRNNPDRPSAARGNAADGPPLYRDRPGDFDWAGLMDLIAGAAWWIDRNSHGTELNEIVQAILDVTRWWP